MWMYPYLPERRLELIDDGNEYYIHVDDRNQVEWLDMDKLKWRCRIQDAHQSAFCGIALFLGEHGYDFSQFTELHWHLDYEGEAGSLRYFFRNREPGFSELGDDQTYKFMQSLISVDFLESDLVIGLDEFYVAEWWLTEYSVPRALSRPSFERISTVGIDLPHSSPMGDHTFQLHSAELVGVWVSREGWYGGIITTWLLVLASAGTAHLVRLRRSVLQERQQRVEVAERNRQLQSQSDEYRELSRQDQLTGMLNRHGLAEAIERLFASPEDTLSLLVLDIDHFKPLNDNHGHDVGDQVLRQLGALLMGSVRQTDRAARWGGEEFVILLPATALADAETIAGKLREKIGLERYEALPDQSVTVSVGVGERHPGEDYHELFKRVDRALYQAKATGRNRVVVARGQ